MLRREEAIVGTEDMARTRRERVDPDVNDPTRMLTAHYHNNLN
jgi:hypothetical protein